MHKQLEIDFAQKVIRKNQFVYKKSNHSMRYWARTDGIILIVDGILHCRVNDQSLLDDLKSTYHNVDGQWFGEVKNLKRLKSILKKHQYEIVNYGPCFIPSREFVPYHDTSIILYENKELDQFKSHPIFTEPLYFDPIDVDVLAMGIVEDAKVVALAGMSENGKYAMELGIEVIEGYRRQGYASRLVRAITTEAIKRFPEKIIVYGTQFTHNQSM